MIRCVIVDDEEMSRVHLRLICGQFKNLEVAGEFDNALCAFEFLKTHEVDLLLLDVEMPKLSGMDLVRSVSGLPAIIFISSKDNYAADAFEYLEKTVDYLVKPVSQKRLRQALERFEQQAVPSFNMPTVETEEPFIFIKVERRYVRISLNELLYVESSGDYSIFKTVSNQYIVNTPLRDINARINHPNFIKVHRSYIINLSKVVDIEDNSLLINGKLIPISRSQRTLLMKRIMPI